MNTTNIAITTATVVVNPCSRNNSNPRRTATIAPNIKPRAQPVVGADLLRRTLLLVSRNITTKEVRLAMNKETINPGHDSRLPPPPVANFQDGQKINSSMANAKKEPK